MTPEEKYKLLKEKYNEYQRQEAVFESNLDKIISNGKEMCEKIKGDEKLLKAAENLNLQVDIDWDRLKSDGNYRNSIVLHLKNIHDKILTYLDGALNEI